MNSPSPAPSPAINLRLLAAACGVSRMTVSRALRGHPEVSEATRKAVLKKARTMGYKPNGLVSVWMSHVAASKRAANRPVILYCASHSTIIPYERTVTLRKFLSGARKRAEECGFDVQEIWLNQPGFSPRRIEKILLTRNVPGLLFAPFEEPTANFPIKLDRFSAVAFNYSLKDPALHRVCHNHFHNVWITMLRLTEMGFKRIGMTVHPNTDRRHNHLLSAAFCRFGQVHGTAAASGLYIDRRPTDKEPFCKWARRYKPDVVLSNNNRTVDFVRETQLVPTPKFVHLDGEYCKAPAFAMLDQNSEMVGAAAVDLVVEMIKHNEVGVPVTPKTILIDGEFRLLEPG